MTELVVLAIAVIFGARLGQLWGQSGWGVACVLAIFLLYHGWQRYRLHRWLVNKSYVKPRFRDASWRTMAGQIDAISTGSSDRRQYAQNFNILRQIRKSSDLLSDAFVIFNQANRISYFNKTAAILFHLKSSDRGNLLTSMSWPVNIEHLLANQENHFVLIKVPRQIDRYFDFQIVPFGHNQRLLLARDVTRFRHLETIREDFITNVSHELRTPLTTILGYLETLVHDPELKTKTIRKIMPKMLRPAQRMQALVEDLMLLSNLDSTSNPKFDVMVLLQVGDIIENIVLEASDFSDDKHSFFINVESGLILSGVEQEIRSAFGNLIMNAVRYSPDGGKIQVNWQSSNQGARFEVKDEGLGIQAQHLCRLTERFYRVDVGRSRIKGGTGLGLAIVKHVLRRHDSELEISSTYGEGSTFACSFKPGYISRIKPYEYTSDSHSGNTPNKHPNLTSRISQ